MTVKNCCNEDHRRECEAREWIKRGYINRNKVNELMTRLTKIRGSEAAQMLKSEMRRQWRLMK